MAEIKYEIKLNDKGRPCIDLPNHKDSPEDKFMVIELARYILTETYNRLSPEFDEEAKKSIGITINCLGQMGDEIAEILWNSMKASGDIQIILGKRYHVTVNSIEERNKIDDKGIIDGDRLYIRQEGLRVAVREDETWKVYELQGGITNDNWVELKPLKPK
jgi:hypothetical protein